jgi:hypothetical protein
MVLKRGANGDFNFKFWKGFFSFKRSLLFPQGNLWVSGGKEIYFSETERE